MQQPEPASCPEHQRLWRDQCVDKNLKDEWLEKLNGLKTLNLISICEGHPGHHRHYYPRMNLRMKNDLIVHVANEWQRLKPAFRDALDRCFPDEDTKFSMELVRRIQRKDKDSPPDDDIIVYVHSRKLRNNDWQKERKNDWFERSITAVEAFDESVKAIVFEGTS